MDVLIINLEKKPSTADLEAFLPHFSLLEALNALFSGPQPRIVLGPERIKEIIETKVSSARTGTEEAGLEPRGKRRWSRDGDKGSKRKTWSSLFER